MNVYLFDITAQELVKFECLPGDMLKRVDAIDTSDDPDFSPDNIAWEQNLLERYFDHRLAEMAR